MSFSLTAYETKLILLKLCSTELIECHLISSDGISKLPEFIDTRRCKKYIILLSLGNMVEMAAVCVFFEEQTVFSIVDFSHDGLTDLENSLKILYPQAEIERLSKLSLPFNMDGHESFMYIEMIRRIVFNEDRLLVMTGMNEREQEQRHILIQTLSEMFPQASFRTALRDIATASLTIWLGIIALTGANFVNLLVYSRGNNENLSSSVIVVTLQRLLLGLAGSPSFITQINFSRALGHINHRELAGRAAQSGWIMGLLSGALAAIISRYAVKSMLITFGLSPTVSENSAEAFASLSLGFIGYAFFTINGRILISLKKERVFMLSSLLSAGLSIMAVRGLAYGEFGLPNLGSTVGYGWGFAVQTWFSCIPTTLYLLSHHRRDLDFFSIHSGILGEIWMGLKHTIPLFFQRNSDVLASFGLAIYSGLLGTSASIAENVAESYRMFFGRVGASSVASAVTAEVANVRGRLDLVLSNAIRLPHSQSRGALATISTVRNAGYVTAGVYGVTLATLYIAVPRLLSSAFLDDEQLADDGLMGKLYITLILAGVGGVLDDIRQVQLANQNASKDFKSTYIPIFINFILMLGLSYVLAFPLDLGVVGLEAGNTCCFLISVLMLIKMISVGDRKYTRDLLQENLETGIYNSPFRRAEELLSFSEDDALSSPLIDHDAPKI